MLRFKKVTWHEILNISTQNFFSLEGELPKIHKKNNIRNKDVENNS